jgi:F1F0 ATPase subunit 2
MVLALVGGLALGLLFFGGLYVSVDRLNTVRYPALMMLGSTVIRMAVLLAGVFLLMQGEVRNAAAALAGVVVAKFVLIYLVRKRALGGQGRE